MNRRKKKSSGVHFCDTEVVLRHATADFLLDTMELPPADDPVMEAMNQAVRDAAWRYMYMATLEQDRFMKEHWDMLCPIIIQCIKCGIRKGAELPPDSIIRRGDTLMAALRNSVAQPADADIIVDTARLAFQTIPEGTD